MKPIALHHAVQRVECGKQSIPGSLQERNANAPSKIGTMRNALFAILTEPKFSDDLQTFDDPNQVLLTRRFQPFTQPREQRSVSIVANRDQRLRSCNCLMFQAPDEVLVRPLSGATTSRP